MALDALVVYAPVGGGHKAAALALVEKARASGLTAEAIDLFDLAPPVVGKAYLAAHLGGTTMTPSLYGKGYFSSNRPDLPFDPFRRGVDQIAFARLLETVRAARPGVVFATHHLPLVVLGRARRKGRLRAPLVGIVTDYTAHAVWAERGVDLFCVACPRAHRGLALHGIPSDRIAMTGIPVRERFERIAPLHEPAAHEPVQVLLTSGSFGVGPLRDLIRSFARIPRVELTVVCGSNVKVRERAEREARQAGVTARVLGFEPDMAARMAEAHVLVGKAGGLTVSECLTAGRPMVLVGTVPGNELANEDRVVSGGAGVAAEPEGVGKAVALLRKRRAFEVMGERARSLVLRGAAGHVLDAAMLPVKGHGIRSMPAA